MVYKSPAIEVSLKKVSQIDINELDSELMAYFESDLYTIAERNKIVNTTHQKGLFYWGTKKGYTSKFAKGLLVVKQQNSTIWIDIKYRSNDKKEVEDIIASFFTGTIIPERKRQSLSISNIGHQSMASEKQVKELVYTEQNEKREEFANDLAGSIGNLNSSQTTNTKDGENISTSDQKKESSKPKYSDLQHKNLIKLTPALKQEFIDSHNRWRADVDVPPIVWNIDMENYAVDWAIKQGENGCKMMHRPNNEYGENIYWSSGREFSPVYIVDDWGSEIKDYHGEIFGKSKGVVGHYTQMVWRTTTEFGCAAFKCGSTILVVCNYNPSGNWIGKHPYKH
jgi:uncharacterized protein YkwD